MSEINTDEVIAWAQDIERRQGTDLQPSNRASSIAAAICDTLSDSYDAPRPTHYAVIDEHGEIAHSVKIKQFREAESRANLCLKAVSDGDFSPEHWAVKGVTVHE